MTFVQWVEERHRRIEAENRAYVTDGVPPEDADAFFDEWRRTTVVGQVGNAARALELFGAALLDAWADALRKVGLLR